MPGPHGKLPTFTDPLRISARYLADPCVFRDGERYFAIGTSSHHPDADGVAYREPDGAAFGVHESGELLAEPWLYRGGLLEPLELPQHWAPEIVLGPDGRVHRDARGEICCFFSAGTDREHWIYLATSPGMDTRFRVKQRVARGTDPHPHFDEDGTPCLVYVTTWDEPGSCIVGTRLDSTLLPAGPVKRLLVPRAPWMNTGSYRIAESPFVKRAAGTSYLLFSGGGWQTNYGLDYAVSDRLLGDYAYDASHESPRLLGSDPVHGIIDPGHCCTIDLDTETYIAHHQWTGPERTTRNAVIRPLSVGPAGTLRVNSQRGPFPEQH